ncbi:MAG: hypothetical protein AB1705_24965, partial [Verrucomicrobiota bacterium]
MLCPPLARAADPAFVWNAETQRVGVDFDNWPLQRVLEQIASTTGWQVQCPDSVTKTVSAKFKNVPVNEAMGKLFGDLNYAMVRTTNGNQLRIFAPGDQTASAARTLVRPTAPATPYRVPPPTPPVSFGQQPGGPGKDPRQFMQSGQP